MNMFMFMLVQCSCMEIIENYYQLLIKSLQVRLCKIFIYFPKIRSRFNSIVKMLEKWEKWTALLFSTVQCSYWVGHCNNIDVWYFNSMINNCTWNTYDSERRGSVSLFYLINSYYCYWLLNNNKITSKDVSFIYQIWTINNMYKKISLYFSEYIS